jgi:uncharacterized protein (TIGR02996 family)
MRVARRRNGSPRRFAIPLGGRFEDSTRELVIDHLATIEDEASPARPLCQLLQRNIYAFALPDSAMLLYVASAASRIDHSTDPIARDFAANLDDDKTCIVYGDYLEERGEIARAEAVRARTGPHLNHLFQHMYNGVNSVVMRSDRTRPRRREPVKPDRDPTPAHLEIDGATLPLAARTGLRDDRGKLVISPSEPTATITCAGGVWWFAGQGSIDLNDRSVYEVEAPLFDGDIVRIRSASAIVRLAPAPVARVGD